jgi:Fe-S cluster assembly protein SufD
MGASSSDISLAAGTANGLASGSLSGSDNGSANGSENGSTAAQQRSRYLQHLLSEASTAAEASGLSLKGLREGAIAQVNERSFPSTRDEEWRFTDLSDLLAHSLAHSAKPALADLPEEAAPEAIAADVRTAALASNLSLLANGYRLASVNGHYVSAFSWPGRSERTPELPEGAVIAPLSSMMAHPVYGERVAKVIADKLAQVQGGGEVFTALNTAGFSDVMVVWLRADQVIEEPICIARGSQGSAVSHLRTLVIAERHARCTLVESFWGDDELLRCNNSVTEILLAEGAQITHVRLQDEGSQTFHIAKTAVSQAANSTYSCTSIDLGAQLSRHHLEVYQAGPQTDTHLYGLSALRASQLADTHSLIALSYPHSSATQIQKNIVDERAHGVFNGKVYVSKTAQQTNAAQLNRNLMLSSKARIDTKPELDIVADNVKCAHGATVSQLQADEVFYLQSRGIAADQAQRLLLYGFAMEIVEKISVEPIRRALSDRLRTWSA